MLLGNSPPPSASGCFLQATCLRMSMTKLRQEIWIKCRSPIIYIPILLFLLLLYIPNLVELNIYSIKMKTDIKISDSDTGFLVKTTGCRIPFLDPFDKSILKYIFKVKPFTCSEVLPLVESDLNTIFIDKKQLPYYNISNQDVLNCYYQPFWRVDPKTGYSDTEYSFGNYTYFNSSAKINEEFIKVVCKVGNEVIYTDFHSFVPMKKAINKTAKFKKKLNVLLIGIDAVSRLNFQRQLPLTKEYLNKLGAIEMIGYNKVGDNTFPNLIPIITGQSVDELQKSCWPTDKTKFDNCDFIWNNYSKAGYLTSYAEDASWMGIFNYLKHGFRKQPTDYYWRTFNYAAEKEIGHTKTYNADLCIGPRPTYLVLMDYIRKFVLSLKNEPYFAFFWGTSLTHDALNYPNQGDKYYKLLFENLREMNSLNDTVLIVLSDHGIRWGDIRSTHQGHLEERLPFLFFIFPSWFSKKYPSAIANVRRNTKRLTTPFDLHETLVDLLNTDLITTDNIKQRSKELNNKRGISLFLPVPDNRTCSSANISAHWCTCQKSVEINKTSYIVQQAADFIVGYMNGLLRGYKSCANLDLDTIMDSRLSVSDDYLENKLPIHDYTVILKTKPGGGLFEATVRCIACNSPNPFNLTGTISRVNLYGNQSACITDYHLKLYCYCGS